jgi:hypothetical protein
VSDDPSASAPADAAPAGPLGNLPEHFPPARFALVAFCEGCGHSARLDRDALPTGVTVQQIPPRLRCTVCGRRPGVLRIVYVGAGGFAHSRGR